jgi:hypothetical protein
LSDKVRVTFYLSNENKDLLDNIAFLKKESKVSLVNKAVGDYLKKILEEDLELKDRLKNLK